MDGLMVLRLCKNKYLNCNVLIIIISLFHLNVDESLRNIPYNIARIGAAK
jgi:hypothetical protein